LTASAAFAQVLSSSDAAKKLHSLFDEDWQWGLEQYPEAATLLGDNRYNDRLTDMSLEAIERRRAHEREMLDRVQRIDRSQLGDQDRVSYDLFLRDKQLNVEGQRFPTEYMPIDQMNGAQISFGQLADSTPFRNAKDYRRSNQEPSVQAIRALSLAFFCDRARKIRSVRKKGDRRAADTGVEETRWVYQGHLSSCVPQRRWGLLAPRRRSLLPIRDSTTHDNRPLSEGYPRDRQR
jgi:hypothetical protein